MAKREKITISSIKALVVDDKRVNDTEVPGFHALISPKGKITFYLYYRYNGKQVNYKLGIYGEITPSQARDLAKAKAGEVANGVDIQAVKKTAREDTKLAKLTKLESFLDEKYLPWLETRNEKTAARIVKSIKTGFPNLLTSQLSTINAWTIEKWRNEKRKTGIKPATINGYVNSLKGAMSRAVEWGLIPNHDLSKVKALRVDNAVVRFLDKMEEQELLATLQKRDKRIKDERETANLFRQQRGYPLLLELRDCNYADHLEPIIIIAMNTGLRKGELLSLRWENVNLVNDVLTISGSNAKSGKTRYVPLNQNAKQAFKNWLADVNQAKAIDTPLALTDTKGVNEIAKANGYVFEGENGNHITDIKKCWGNLLEEAGITKFRFHDLRHHFASKLVMAGADLNTVRELLGHSNLDMTLRYAHLAPEHKAIAVSLLN
ncbi:site-specific integrase [Aliiglaciecola lipolytica]|uniref:site-specific integrase n=1 Tax=Aliiglaciecola lipolytica TaxID=477689 RepID=UPI001C0917B5|nr:site-specific integrase [Aliiglaciecola lipolytica]MBU2877711.1 site-specific integrase [Aliiglaciecola lipolytica]